MADGELLNNAMDELELIERNLILIDALKAIQPAGIIRLSEYTSLPRHKVRYSLRLLEGAGIVGATTEGAVLQDGYEDYIRRLDRDLQTVSDRASGIRSKLRT